MSRLLFILLSAFIACSALFSEPALPQDVKTLIAKVAAATDTNEADSLVAAWTNRLLPIVEGNSVTFLYYDLAHRREAVSVALSGSWNGYATNAFLARAGQSGLFYTNITLDHPDDALYSYQVATADGSIRVTDPLNPNVRLGKVNRSVIRLPDSAHGTLRIHAGWKPLSVNAKRNIYVWLPPKYFAQTNRRYPVLYMQDGQQVWDSESAAKGGWKADSSAEKLIASGEIRPFILVGIENSAQRVEEYIGYSAYYGLSNTDAARQKKAKEYSEGYAAFVVNELKPTIDRSYRTLPDRDNTFVAGSSFGAGVSLHLGFSESAVFSGIGSFSGGNYEATDKSRAEKNYFQVFPYLIDRVIHKTNAIKVYLDCGGKDIDAIFRPRTEDMHNNLLRIGYREGSDLLYLIDPNAGHSEPEWAKRFPGFLRFMLGQPRGK